MEKLINALMMLVGFCIIILLGIPIVCFLVFLLHLLHIPLSKAVIDIAVMVATSVSFVLMFWLYSLLPEWIENIQIWCQPKKAKKLAEEAEEARVKGAL